jgi:hypothetical protein
VDSGGPIHAIDASITPPDDAGQASDDAGDAGDGGD